MWVGVSATGFSPIFKVFHTWALLAALLLTIAKPAHADCGAFQPLVAMHDAYRALLLENLPHTKVTAAKRLTQMVPIHSARSFERAFNELDLDIELARLEKVLVDAFFMGRNALSGQLARNAMTPVHMRNADWLTDTIARTGCFRHLGPQAVPGSEQQVEAETTEDQTDAPKKSERSSPPPTQALTVALAALLAGLLGYLIYHSRPLRIKRVERLPRHSVAFKSSASFEATHSAIIVLDISMGGAKIECDHPPKSKEAIMLHLPCGSVPATIVWATAFYAGVMFENHLTQTELDTVLNDEGVTTRSRISNVF